MSNNTKAYDMGGPLTVLTLIFITLKLCKVITWSWWWVLCPIWIPLAVMLLIVAFCVVVAMKGK